MQFTQGLRRAVQTRSRSVATIFQGRSRTYGEIGERVPRVASALVKLGVKPGDRVALLALNNDNFVEMFYAIAWVGAVSVPLNTRWAEKENTYALNDCGAKILCLDDAFLSQISTLRANTGIEHAVYLGESGTQEGCLDYADLIADNDPMLDQCGSDDDLCGIYFTGGTTGMPKGVMLSHKNMHMGMLNWIALARFSDDTRSVLTAGFFHLAGSMPLFSAVMAGGVSICLPSFTPELTFKSIQDDKANTAVFVPTMITMMLNDPSIGDYDLTPMRDIVYGASPIPETTLNQIIEKLPTWEFSQVYGMTEVAALTLHCPWKYHFDNADTESKRTATGRVSYGFDLKIVDEDGNEVPRGIAGEITMRGPQVMLGYWNKPEETAAALNDGWLRTGDGAFMDEDGFVTLVDRVKDMIISGGENVYSTEVENAVVRHDAVMQCAVIAIPSDKWGETVHAIVVLKQGKTVTAEELTTHCHTEIAGYKCPRSIEFRDELPISAAGKILKADLRAPFWKGKARGIN